MVHKEERGEEENKAEEKKRVQKCEKCNILLQQAQGWDVTPHLIVASDPGHEIRDKEMTEKE